MNTPPVAWLVPAAVLIGLCSAALAPAYVDHDAAWYLHMAAVWLDGGTLYEDVIDTNPPFIVFLTAVPVCLARISGIPAPVVFKMFVLAAAGVATIVSIPLIRRAAQSDSSRFVLAAALVFVLFPYIRSDFGQREHFTVILVVPFGLAMAVRAAGRPVSARTEASLGIPAGLGFAMKPHFIVAWLAVELGVLLQRSRSDDRARPGTIAVAASLLAYLFIVALLVPQYIPVAREVMLVYGGLNAPPATLLRLFELRLWVVAAAAILLIRLPREARAPCLVLFAAATGFLVAAMLQMKGWGYHLYPFRALVLLSMASLVGGVTDSHPAVLSILRGGRLTVQAAVLAGTTLWSARFAAQAWQAAGHVPVASLVAIVERVDAESLAQLSIRRIIYPAFPTVNYSGADWVLRYHSLWFLPGLYQDELAKGVGHVAFRAPADMSSLERQYYDQIVADLCARPPQLLIIEPPAREHGGGSLDLVGYYRQDARFARLFEAYAPLANVDSFVVYARRSDAASCEAR